MKKVLFVVFASAAFVACNSSETKETKTDSPVVAPVVVDTNKTVVVDTVKTVVVDTVKTPKMEEKK